MKRVGTTIRRIFLRPGVQWTCIAGTLTWALLCHAVMFPGVVRNDFGKFYDSALLWFQGDSMYGPSFSTWYYFPDTGQGLQLWNLNPPHFEILFLPLARWLAPQPAYLVWLGINAVCGITSVDWILRELGWHLRGRPAWWVIAAALAATPTYAVSTTGQFAGLLMLLVTWMWRSWRHERWIPAGVAVGIAASIKLFFAPLIAYLLLTRRWRALFAAITACFACFAVGILVFGWSEQLAWLRVVRSVSWPFFPMNSSLTGPFTRAAVALRGEPFGPIPDINDATALGILASAPFLGFGLWCSTRDRDSERALFTLLITIVLTFPVGWVYYWWMFTGPLAAQWKDRVLRRAFMLASPAVFVPFWWLWPIYSPVLAFTVGSTYTWALLFVWCSTVRRARGGFASSSDDYEARHPFWVPGNTCL